MTHEMTVLLDDGTRFDCEFEVIEHGSPGNGWDDPGEGSIVGLVEATDEHGALWLMSDELADMVECELAQMLDADPHFFDMDD